jgi:hypothetical protein
METYLKIPFSEKEAAKTLGAKWDWKVSLWYAPTPEIREACSRWPEVPYPAEVKPIVTRINRNTEIQSKTIRGDRYFTMHCNCLPWEPCSACLGTLTAIGSSWQQSVQEAHHEC